MAIHVRPSLVTAGFAVLFAIIADLAWATAITTTGPWFGASVGLTVYSESLVLATVLVVVLVHQATARAARLDASLVRLDRRIALLRAGRSSRPPAPSLAEEPDPDFELGGIADGGSPALVRLEKEGHDTLFPLPAESSRASGAARVELQRQLSRERMEIRHTRASVWSTAAGPLLMAVAFLAIAGPMLPGSDGFASVHYVLNTTLILFLSYGFAPLVAWTVIALALTGSPSRNRAT